MKIYILPVSKEFQPQGTRRKYPRHNTDDSGVEQDFVRYLNKNPSLVTSDPNSADWHYLPIYWTRYHKHHDHGKYGLGPLQEEVKRRIINDSRTFTICQWDGNPLVDVGETRLFLAARKETAGIDIPILCSPHRIPMIKPAKKYLASFVGRLATHPIRYDMNRQLGKRRDVYVRDRAKGTRFFVKQMLRSYIALCPRGSSCGSFRFYEAMQLGVVPMLIGDVDTRPFKTFVDWDKISLYARSIEEARDILDSHTTAELLQLGQLASEVWREKLTFGKWCRYVVRELEAIS